MITTYEYYTMQFGGRKVPSGCFVALEIEAARYIDHVTFHRIRDMADIPDEVQDAVCAVAEVFYARDQRAPGATTENVDGMSVSYKDTPEAAANKQAYAAAKECLAGTGLLYRGVMA